MARSRIYEEGNIAARKSPAPRSIMHNGKVKEVKFDTADQIDLRDLFFDLIGREFKTAPLIMEPSIVKTVRISDVFPKIVTCDYITEKTVTKQKVCFSVSDLVLIGILSFENGKPEVVT